MKPPNFQTVSSLIQPTLTRHLLRAGNRQVSDGIPYPQGAKEGRRTTQKSKYTWIVDVKEE